MPQDVADLANHCKSVAEEAMYSYRYVLGLERQVRFILEELKARAV
jgi:hypothetical protein